MSNGKKKYVEKGVSTTVNTVAIGAIAAFEEVFGDLWGMDVPEDLDLSDEQYENYKKWMEVRDRILKLSENSKKILLGNLERVM